MSPVSQNTNDLRSFFGDEDEEEAQLGVTFIIYKVLCLGKRENRHLLAPGEIMTTSGTYRGIGGDVEQTDGTENVTWHAHRG